MPDELPFSFEIEVAALPPEGQRFELVPDDAALARLAAAASVVAVPKLRAVFDVKPVADGSVDVSGDLSATVRQTCVVSLEEFENEVSEKIAVDFVESPEEPSREDEEGEDDDIPDPIVGGKIDLGALATEFLILGVDPYPRKPGAELAVLAPEEPDEAPKRNPFEALSSLRERSKK